MTHATVVVTLFLATGLAALLFVWKSVELSQRMGVIDQPAPRRAIDAIDPPRDPDRLLATDTLSTHPPSSSVGRSLAPDDTHPPGLSN